MSQVLVPQLIVRCFFVFSGFLFSVFWVFFFISRYCYFVFVCVLGFYLLIIIIIIILVAASGREGCVLGSFCFFVVSFLLSFCREKGYFILGVGGVRDSSSAGQSLT